MIKVSKEKWNSISNDYKGIWSDWRGEAPHLKGRKTVLSGCISDKIGSLLFEGIDFIIE